MRVVRWIPVNQVIPFLAGAVLTVFLEMLSNELIESTQLIKIAFVVVGLVLLGGTLLYRLRPRRVRVNMAIPHILRQPEEAAQFAKRGMVAFVSLYYPVKSPTAKVLSDRQKHEAAANLDYEVLDLENSNLEPVIKSVIAHEPRLEHCWLIATSSSAPDQAGSALYVPVLVRYLKEVKGARCQFHHGPEWTIPLEDDVVLAQKAWNLVLKSFAEAEHESILSSDMVADITSGFRAMTLGMVLACLDSDRDVQLMGTHYDGRGRAVGTLFPIRFPFDVQLAAQE